jgi:carbamoyl-phosphate synthase small subunit
LRDVIARIALEDGTVLRGESIGAAGSTVGEVVFNTSLAGYQEIFTDPSYNGQIVVMTNPLIGNYGVNIDDDESRRVHVRGVVIRELSRRTSNFRSEQDLGSFLRKHDIVGIAGVDTRAITKRLRVSGSLKGVIATGEDGSPEMDVARLVERAREWEGLEGRDMVREVTCEKAYSWDNGFRSPFSKCFRAHREAGRPGEGLRIAAYDFGIKHNILRILLDTGFDVTVLPAHATPEEVRALRPHGIFLSNGPGDPEGLPYAAEAVRSLIQDYPTFGICLGHQIACLALGGSTYKLKFGHHGGNHPVQDIGSGKVEISVQNHCYAVEPDSLGPDVKPSSVNLNDRSNEGIYHTKLPLFTVQFHPEAAPGPNDFTFLFDRFAQMVKRGAPLEW